MAPKLKLPYDFHQNWPTSSSISIKHTVNFPSSPISIFWRFAFILWPVATWAQSNRRFSDWPHGFDVSNRKTLSAELWTVHHWLAAKRPTQRTKKNKKFSATELIPERRRRFDCCACDREPRRPMEEKAFTSRTWKPALLLSLSAVVNKEPAIHFTDRRAGSLSSHRKQRQQL